MNQNLKLIWAIITWIPKVFALIFLDLLTTILSPVLCLFVIKEEESYVTGFPSQFPGKPREFLIKPLRMFQSFDAPLDEYWYGDYTGWPKTGKTQMDYVSSWWLRYLCRIVWLNRNPAYGFGQYLGYDSTGMKYLIQNDNTSLWASGKPNSSFWLAINDRGQIGWWYKAQIYFYKTHCLEINLGYKLDSDTTVNRHVVAMQFTPFRKYEVKQ
jgi:hypothetical protein